MEIQEKEMEIGIVVLLIVLAVIGWFIYRKSSNKPVIPGSGGSGSSKKPRKLN